LHFEDGQRRIDFILAWDVKDCKKKEQAEAARNIFENNLRNEGLEIEYDRVCVYTAGWTFTLISTSIVLSFGFVQIEFGF
jgi:hypothetical protein